MASRDAGSAGSTSDAVASGVDEWHRVVATRDASLLAGLLADDAVFYSPVVFRAQEGKALTTMYLAGAMQVLGNDTFTYVREVVAGHDAVLEFTSQVDGVTVNGVDMIRFDDAGRIVEFKVMLRPLKGIEKVRERMAELLAQLSAGGDSDPAETGRADP